MERYSEYKDSGEQWLGEIPSHWEVKRLGSYFSERKMKVSDKDFQPLSVTKAGIMPQLENVAKSNDSDNRKLVRKGDFVINSRSDRKGSSGVSPLDGSVSLINIVLEPRKNIFAPFCNYLLKSSVFVEEYYRNGRGIVADLWTTRYDEMKSIKLSMPPLSEQSAIVAYLDRITSQLDEAIAQQQRMIDLLNERKQIIIQHAVTKGLNPKAEMVESGVEWIRRMPKHWEIMSFRHKINVLTDYTANGSFGDLAANVKYLDSKDYARLVRLTDLRANFEEERGVWVNKYSYEYLSKSALNGGELLIANVGAYSGLPWIMPKVDFKATLAPNMFLLRLQYVETEYIYYLLMSQIYFNQLQMIASATAQPKLNKNNIKELPIIVPPMEEQLLVVNYLKSISSEIDSAISNCHRQITLLRERKQIIINEVVTGKVKVS